MRICLSKILVCASQRPKHVDGCVTSAVVHVQVCVGFGVGVGVASCMCLCMYV